MAKATINKINAAIAGKSVEVVKGNGYFYFADIGNDYVAESIPSYYSCQLGSMSLEEWVDYVDFHLARAFA